MDHFKWLLVLLVLIVGLGANYYFAQTAWAIRAAAGIVWGVIMVAIALWTTQGQKAWGFIKASRGELRKVVWPTRQETTQTTLVVMAMVLVTALVLWGLDTLFFWAVSMITGQRG
ncbi:MAG: preprotein translocase subunit SecE [Proteobacteria bacterium]|nr:preprotein translocase subunit SecE [Pseudomonadota bacterium]